MGEESTPRGAWKITVHQLFRAGDTTRCLNRDLRSDPHIRRHFCPHCNRKCDRDGGGDNRRLLCGLTIAGLVQLLGGFAGLLFLWPVAQNVERPVLLT